MKNFPLSIVENEQDSSINNLKLASSNQMCDLNSLFKARSQNTWFCQTCSSKNDETDSQCASCETPRFLNQISTVSNHAPTFGFKISPFNSSSSNTVSTKPFVESIKTPESTNIKNHDDEKKSSPLLPLPLASNSPNLSSSQGLFMNFDFKPSTKPDDSNSVKVSNFKATESIFNLPDNGQKSLFSFGQASNNNFKMESIFSKPCNQSMMNLSNTNFFKSDNNTGFNSMPLQLSKTETEEKKFENKPIFGNHQFTSIANNITANNEISMAKKENETREIVTQNSTKVSSSEFFVLPKVHLPDNYDHKTGEEDDEIIYQVDRAKLYIFVDGEYKERGVGCLKLLKNKQNQKFRLVMRRDLVYKVCLNFLLTNNLKFEMRNDHNVSFQCIDHSDINSPEPLTCLLRISEKEKMKKLVELLRKFSASPNSSPNKSANNGKIVENSKANIQKAEKVVKEEDNDCELIFVNEPTPEQKKLIETLKLPLSFFSFENRGPCKGCIGCKVDELSWNNLTRSVVEEESDFKDSSIFTSLQNQFHSVESSEKRIDDIGTKGFSNENSKC